MNPIRIGILGYGNLGRGIELAVAANDDMELVGVFTRRDPASVHPLGENVAVWPATELAAHTDDIDVLMLAGGSATDIRINADLIIAMKHELAEITAAHTGHSIEQILADSDRDHWFSAAEALDYGFVDHIVSSSREIQQNGEN